MNTPVPAPPPPHPSTRYPFNSDSRPNESRPGESTASNGDGPDDLREHAHRDQHTHRDSAYGEPIVFGLDKFGLIVVSLVLTVFVGFMVSLVLIYRPSSTAYPAPPMSSSTAASAPTSTASPTPTLSPELEAQREAAYSVAPPEENPQMFTNTDEGGAATADYFVRVMNFAFVSGNPAYVEAMSDPDCQFCASVVERAHDMTSEGQWVDSYELSIEPIVWDPPTEARPFGFATVTMTQGEHTIHRKDGDHWYDSSNSTIDIGMYWNGERWIVRGVTVNE